MYRVGFFYFCIVDSNDGAQNALILTALIKHHNKYIRLTRIPCHGNKSARSQLRCRVLCEFSLGTVSTWRQTSVQKKTTSLSFSTMVVMRLRQQYSTIPYYIIYFTLIMQEISWKDSGSVNWAVCHGVSPTWMSHDFITTEVYLQLYSQIQLKHKEGCVTTVTTHPPSYISMLPFIVPLLNLSSVTRKN